ncbi:protein PLANT CADMIUM RESISTANCE 2-like [Anarrhichthys ocellatus]|uniref:protein PLANT CADMIUM RESISTANCE 2-like n=1 Tax=Anarrhichthys ocellatus TaxID=433405 RepID=UPI0012EDFBB4|nr:protein PLANT CADMIUM RESISTANCE 2-like [Anarrhichthys ocellatus]
METCQGTAGKSKGREGKGENQAGQGRADRLRNREGDPNCRLRKVHCLLPVAKVFQQQMAAQPLVHWKSGLFDCFEDANTCCYGFWCCPCLACTVSGRFGENRCLPLCDIFSPAILAACGIPLFVPPAVLSLRAGMRNRYGIKGSICKDIAVSCFCSWCSWCQMHQELKHHTETPVVVTVQNQNVIQMQPAPVMMAPVYPAQPAFVNYPGVITIS